VLRGESTETPVSPLPPPVTQAVYRAHWFELLDAFHEGDELAARVALTALTKSARSTGVRRLADYSRTALHDARTAERAGRIAEAGLAYDAAVALDDTSFDAAISRLGFLIRQRHLRDALSAVPPTLTTIFASAESRLSFASSAAIMVALAVTATALATALGLFFAHFPRLSHDLREFAGRPFGQRAAIPLAFVLLTLPIFVALGPIWLVLYWSALAYAYSARRERVILALALIALSVVPLMVEVVARENFVRRSPIYLAAVDLAERREDSSVEDGLAAVANANPDQSDSWFLLALYAERAGDNPRALSAYGRAIQADPKDYRPFVNRGNVRFVEGEYTQAISDYEEAIRRAPEAAEAFYNLSVARSEIYDFKGQEAARARALQISRRDVDAWSSAPTLSRVVPAAYRISAARRGVRSWRQRTAGPLSHPMSASALVELAQSPLCLGPWGALVFAWMYAGLRSRIGVATECSRCGRAFCRRCKRNGGPPLFCGRCVRLSSRKEEAGEEVRKADRRDTERRHRRRRRVVQISSLLAPGIHGFFSRRPVAAAAKLLLFFFALSLAIGGPWLFELAPLAPPGAAQPGRIAAAGVALLLWLAAIPGARRTTRES
jgi:tetratricopeptide (TPR) repeat protein